MKKTNLGLILATAALAMTGCTANQASQVGMRSSTVTKTAQQMSNLEICETYAYGRSTTQTRVAIASEWTRRGLNHKYCDEIVNELYITAWTK
ncbi:hypothetical protein [Photobacterium sp.]|uniref:hypothetical protein n=1 Tax=Photobacterium sp. TaxID=660 RepID=UPI00299D11C9|nr:hypothetical protein [Photobacterium sp.]MDX1301769.1 hypothetical protein [Photobacterium sp.]